ncbi:glutathione S-transferase family protein [Gammaproteobacteria bacterium]|jgi:glutathione S-transferase|nr:glutathione S-transferase family protein [Gammaproteobacteria bacterium]MDB4029840.1 glutathione S-transferase family protein [Gammaproteobacteria bacterium]MDB9934990.1 glutathione S-transferase family protein [Gammaproteobacteria bacterium]MDB9947336.1 glutathione S-transferase family protein [Gammaproteobacteria bacterium]MDC0130071.1 glutathione S-transferase family protein [Gammaproteobacteria bacterium]
MKLYDNPMANSPRKVRMFLVEKNITDVEIVNIDLMQGEHKTPEYRAIAPNSRIPALQLDDGTVVMESTAICRYLESLYPEPNLFGESPMEIASIEMWQCRVHNELMIPLAMGFRHLHPAMAKMETQNKEYGETQKNIGMKSLKYFNGVLAESKFIAGERYTFADIQMISTTDFFIGLNQLELEDYPEIERHTKLMSERPSFSA